MLKLSLEAYSQYSRECWKRFVSGKGGRANNNELEFYQFMKNELSKSLTELNKELMPR